MPGNDSPTETRRSPRPMTRLVAFLSLIPTFSLLAASVGKADDPTGGASLLYTASDLPGLADGVTIPQAGVYTIKVWSSSLPNWSYRSGELQGQAITLA